MTPTIKAAIEKKRAASVASKIAHDAWVSASKVVQEAKAAAESAHETSVDASVALRNTVAAELGVEVSEVGLYHGDIWLCLDGQEMTYDEAVGYLAQRRAR